MYPGHMRVLAEADKFRSDRWPVCLTPLDDAKALAMLPCAHISTVIAEASHFVVDLDGATHFVTSWLGIFSKAVL